MLLFDEIILFIHLFAATLFVGGSFFMQLVLVPASRRAQSDRLVSSRIIFAAARRFGVLTNAALIVLVLTAMYNATWYLPGLEVFSGSLRADLLLIKSSLTLILIVMVYIHGAYFGRRMAQYLNSGNTFELERIRRIGGYISLINLALMGAILLVATLMQLTP